MIFNAKPALFVLAITAAVGVVLSLAQTQRISPAPDFVPDWTFTGSSLNGWQQLGGASWKAQNGEIIGTPAQGGGWLLLDKSYQDVQFFSRLRCEGQCDAGVLLRIRKSSAGMSGIFVSLKEGDLHCYNMTVDDAGKILTRELITNTTSGTIRIGPPPAPESAGSPAARRGPGTTPPSPLPELQPPAPGFGRQQGGWDQFAITYDANIVRPYLNNTNQYTPSITADSDAYGPIALYVGGTGATHFKDVSMRDVAVRKISPEHVSSHFRMQKLEEFNYAWGVAVGDINRDGNLDIVSGPYYYLGPGFTERHEIYLGQPYNPGREYAPNMVTHVFDFNGDGWPDVLATELRAMVLYINPRGENRRWSRYPVLPTVSSEITVMKDLDGDGRPEIVFDDHGTVVYAKYDPANVTVPWAIHKVSEPGLGMIHSLGVADLNGDGHPDIIAANGWWEQPADKGDHLWKYHPVAFASWGRSESAGGGEIFAYDVNGDGLPDVVTSLNAHGWGLAWFEQKRVNGEITFVRHMIMDNFSTANAGGATFAELHALTIADVDGDGVQDIITGKRYWSHQDSYADPDSYGDAVLYWFRTVRNPKAPGGAEFVPELIHNRSGVGSQTVAVDLNKDHAVDIVTATVKGLFVFWGQPRAK